MKGCSLRDSEFGSADNDCDNGRSVRPYGATEMTEAITEYLQPYQRKTILVSGAGGYIGSALVAALNCVDCRLALVCRDRSHLALPDGGAAKIRVVQADLSVPDAWKSAFAGADVIFHLAAFEHRHGSPFDPLLDAAVNARSVLSLLERCRELGAAPRIVLASSSNLVGLPTSLPVDESLRDNPLTLYAIHKQTAEQYLHYYRRAFGIPSIALRLVNVYGPSPSWQAGERVVVNRIVRLALAGGPLVLFRNHDCIRDYLYIEDALSAFLIAGMRPEKTPERHYLIGSGEGVSIAELVDRIAEGVSARLGRKPEMIVNEQAPVDEGEWRNLVADSSRFRDIAGWRPRFSLAQGLKRTIEELS